MIITERVFKKSNNIVSQPFKIREENSKISSSGNSIVYSIQETPVRMSMIQENISIKHVEERVNLGIQVGIKGDKGDKGDAGEPGSGINAEQIQGLPVDTASPKEGELFYFDGAKWTAKDGREESCLNFNTIINGGYF